MTTTPLACATVPDSVLFRELDGEAVILNLETETYFGLNESATRMWEVVTTATSIAAAVDALIEEYEVDRDELERDVLEFVETLRARSLLHVTGD
ncbi:MAG: PqqD family protein [Acidimicrobiia bacterium]